MHNLFLHVYNGAVRGVAESGKKSIKVRTTKSEKRRITAVLACTATGDMLAPMVVFKGTTNRCVSGVRSSEGTLVSYQKKVWIDENEMWKWIRNIWIRYTKKKPSLLFLDSFSAHLTDQVKKRSHTSTLPLLSFQVVARLSSILQPLDVSINKPVKAVIRRSWEQYMLEQSERQNFTSFQTGHCQLD